jgi:hypothetical protein
MIDYEKIILDRINKIKEWPCCRPLENDEFEGFLVTSIDGNETEYMCLTSSFGMTQYVSISKKVDGCERGILLYLIDLETGGITVETDLTLPGEEFENDRYNLSDIKGGLFNSEPLWFKNKPMIIDTTQPPVQEMTWEEIAKTIVSEMMNPENLHHWDEEEPK